jgi:putative SOS response-associated peptidase YedK
VTVFLQKRDIIGGMCGRYGFSVKDAKDVYERFDTYNELSDYQPRWNVVPGQLNPVVTRYSPNQISRMVWRLIPHWTKDDSLSEDPKNLVVAIIAAS